MSRFRERLVTTSERDRNLRVMLVLAHEALRQRGLALTGQAVRFAAEPTVAATAHRGEGYQELIARIHDAVARTVPRGARLLVISRGDAELFVPGYDSAHFPQGQGGAYAGHYPSDGPSAVAHLEECIGGGAEYLVIPATGFWWLDYYGELARHLLARGRITHHDQHCLICDLNVELQRETA
jgi:hypothetical protein